MIKKALAISIIVPVFNEEDYLKPCLDALAEQTAKDFEVIVVDNNSTDRTIEVAGGYPFVTVIREKRQGKVFAQEAGIEHATNPILARIDADTILPKTWVKNVVAMFDDDASLQAITGTCYFYDFPFRKLTRLVHICIYYYLQRLATGCMPLWGSNMAVRRDAWMAVKEHCSPDPLVHEDIDLSIQLKKAGYKVKLVPNLIADVSLRRGSFSILKEGVYLLRAASVYWKAGFRLRSIVFGSILAIIFAFLLPLLLVWQIVLGARAVLKTLSS